MGETTDRRYDLVIFDLDGTLVDTRDGIISTFRSTLEAAGYPAPPPETVSRLIGLPLHTMFRTFLPEPAADELLRELVEAYRARYWEVVRPQTRAFPEVVPTLDRLRRAGLGLAIATSKLVRIAEEALEAAQLTGIFAPVLGGDSVPRTKPAPDLVLQILAERATSADRALVVGDTGHDVAMGKAAGAWTCGVTYGAQTRAELLEAGPDHLVDRFGDLLEIVGLGRA